MSEPLQLAVEGWIADLPEIEFRSLVARTRPPTEPIPVRGDRDRD
jgi:hypothetical protein